MAKGTKERILEAALDMFSQYGFAGTNIRELAGSLGMGKSSMYRHFESKEELLLSEKKGAVVETFVISELLKRRTNAGRKGNLTYFRDRTGFEVDTIADWKHSFAIEIKSNSEKEAKASKSLSRYLELRDDPGTKGAVFYLGDVSMTMNGVDYVGWRDWGTYQE